jgi:AraC-like DNA-binding protein
MQHFDQSRTDFTPYGLTCELWSPASMPRPDRHNEIEINFLRSGSLTYLLGGRYTTVNEGEIALFWAAIPHQIVKCDSIEPYFVVTLPLVWFLNGGFPQSLTHLALTGEIVRAQASTIDEERFGYWVEDFQSGEPALQRAAELEIQARLLRLVPEVSVIEDAPMRQLLALKDDYTLSRADQIACYIAQHYNEPLTAERIASAVNLHPNYAMGLFRKAFGTTITDFLIQHRISHAQRQLVTTNDPIIEIAAAAGFQSLSRFNEAFKSNCGCSPRAYRMANRGQ